MPGTRGGPAALLATVMAAVLIGAAAGTAHGQACGVATGRGAAAHGGYVQYDLGAGVSGAMIGLDVTSVSRPAVLPGQRFESRLGYRTILLEPGPNPHIVRQVSAMEIPITPLRFSLCPALHAGGSWVTIDDEPSFALAGGLGLRVAGTILAGAGTAVPYAEVRGLAAYSTGTVFDIEVEGTGLAVGVEAGLLAAFGRLTLQATASLDGLDGGLGLTPYPRAAGELSAGVRF